MAEQVASTVAGRVVDSLFGVVKTEISYMWNSKENVEKFKNEVEKLKVMKRQVQQQIDIAVDKGDNLKEGVKEWLKKADDEISKAEEFLEKEANAKKTCFKIGLCGNWATLHHYGKNATKMALSLPQLQASGTPYEGGVSVYTRVPGKLDAYENKDLDGIGTHNLALNAIIAALDDESKQIIGIYGLGGVGKTTLAMEVATRVKTRLFADVAFITVSQTVAVDKIKKDTENATKRIMNGDKILIILDDVWETLNLLELCIPCGSKHKNCKILLTSRSESVCENMNAQSKIFVNSLPIKEAWILFKRVVGEQVETEADLKPVAKEVAKECGGLPLLIKVVGSTLKNKSIGSWNSALSRLKKPAAWEMSPDIEKAFTTLQLSYDYLKSEEARSCFLLCSMFPENYNISLEALVYYMVGLRKFDDLESMEDARDRVQDAVNMLKSSCLLLNVEDEDEKPRTKMHDVVRDVAVLIASKGEIKDLVKASKGENKYLIKAGKGLTEWLPLRTNSSLKSYTGISLMKNMISKLPDYEVHLSSLDIFLVNDNHELPRISGKFFEGMKDVKVLDMGMCFNAQLPESLKELTKLCMLNLQGNKSFHEISILGEMKELEILLLSYTGIKEIPEKIGELVNLRRLELIGCRDMTRVTPGVISKLQSLEELCIDFMGVSEGVNGCTAEVMKLPKLTYLDLKVNSLDLIPEGFNSEKLTGGFVIQIGYFYRGNKIRRSDRYLIISSEHLVIPLLKWLKKLIEVSRPRVILQRIENLNNIMPTLYDEGLNKLERIQLGNCSNVSCLVDDGTSYHRDEGKTKEKFLMQLKHLELYKLKKLEVVWKCPDEYICLANLVNLFIDACSKLARVFTVSVAHGLVNLKVLEIKWCVGLEEVIWGVGGGGEEIDSGRGVGESEKIVAQQQQHSSSSSSADNNTNNIIIVFPSLASIYLGNLDNLKSFVNSPGIGNGNCIIKYPSLVDVQIHDCKSMKKWGPGIHETPSLKTLVVDTPVPILDGPCALNEAVEKSWHQEDNHP